MMWTVDSTRFVYVDQVEQNSRLGPHPMLLCIENIEISRFHYPPLL